MTFIIQNDIIFDSLQHHVYYLTVSCVLMSENDAFLFVVIFSRFNLPYPLVIAVVLVGPKSPRLDVEVGWNEHTVARFQFRVQKVHFSGERVELDIRVEEIKRGVSGV